MAKRSPLLLLPIAMFAAATFFYLYEFLLRVSPNVLEDELILAFGMDASAFGFFSSCYYWPYAPLQLPVGVLTDKFGPRRLLTFAIFLCAISTIAFAYTHEFLIGCITRFFIGFGSAFAFISCLKIVNIWFQPHLFPLMTGLTLAIGNLGAAVGGTPLSFALHFMPWRSLMCYLGLLGLLLGIASWVLIRDHNPDHPTDSMKPEDTPSFMSCLIAVVKLPQSWIVGVYAFFVTAPMDAFGGTWGVKFLTEAHGISRDMASMAGVTMTFIGMAVGSPLLGWISEYFDNRKISMIISAMVAAIALTLIIYLPHLTGWMAAILFFLFGASGTYVLAFVMARRLANSIYVATAVGFVNMVSMFGSALLTWLIGWLLDISHSGGSAPSGELIYTLRDYHFSLTILPAFYLISALLVVPLIRDEKGSS